MLGLVGSLMQQLTQNTLTSPLTLGTSSGAWLALIVVNIWFPDLIADYSALAAMVGALCAFGVIVLITGVNNMTGLPLVVSGMVVNILLGSIATAIILLNEQFAQNVFMWGAGDLAQNGWHLVGFSIYYCGRGDWLYRFINAKHCSRDGGKNAKDGALFEHVAWCFAVAVYRHAFYVVKLMDGGSSTEWYHN